LLPCVTDLTGSCTGHRRRYSRKRLLRHSKVCHWSLSEHITSSSTACCHKKCS